jgi:hypothetical protein
MRANAPDLGIDPTRIAIGGTSAGAITSLFEAYSELGSDAETQVVMSLMGAMYGFESLIDANDPPFIEIHGEDDTTVPYSLALDLKAGAIAAGIPFEFYSLPGVAHTVPLVLQTWEVDGVTLAVKIRDFLYTHLNLAALNETPEGGEIVPSTHGFIEEGDTFTLTAPAGSNYQWKKNGNDLAEESPRLTGVNEAVLRFDPIEESDTGTYTVLYEPLSKSPVESQPLNLIVLPAGSLPVSGLLTCACLIATLIMAGRWALARQIRA